jgi:threonyl-tRNA synthetase
MLVAGDRESAEGTIAVRTRKGGDQGSRPVAAFVASARAEIDGRLLESADLGPNVSV